MNRRVKSVEYSIECIEAAKMIFNVYLVQLVCLVGLSPINGIFFLCEAENENDKNGENGYKMCLNIRKF